MSMWVFTFFRAVSTIFFGGGGRGRIGLMINVREAGLSSPGSSRSQGYCIAFLGKTLFSHSASLHPGV